MLLLFSCSVVSDSAAPWIAACQASLSFTISQTLLKLMSIEVGMPSNHLILCRPVLLLSVFPSMRVFSNELAFHIRWPKYWSFSFSISSSSEYSGLISFRMDWLDLLAVQDSFGSHQVHGLLAGGQFCGTSFFPSPLVPFPTVLCEEQLRWADQYWRDQREVPPTCSPSTSQGMR